MHACRYTIITSFNHIHCITNVLYIVLFEELLLRMGSNNVLLYKLFQATVLKELIPRTLDRINTIIHCNRNYNEH